MISLRTERSIIDDDSNYVKRITENSSIYKNKQPPFPNLLDSSSEDIRKSAHHKKNKSDFNGASRTIMNQNYINENEKLSEFRPSNGNTNRFYGKFISNISSYQSVKQTSKNIFLSV